MGRIDETKYIYKIFLILCILVSFIPLLASYHLINVDSYDSFQNLLSHFYVTHFYFGRVVLSNLDFINFSIIKLIVSLLKSLNLINYIILLLDLYLLCSYDESYMKKRKYFIYLINGIYSIGIFSIMLIFLLGFNLSSLEAIMILFKYAGIVLAFMHLSIVLACIKALKNNTL